MYWVRVQSICYNKCADLMGFDGINHLQLLLSKDKKVVIDYGIDKDS